MNVEKIIKTVHKCINYTYKYIFKKNILAPCIPQTQSLVVLIKIVLLPSS